MTHHERWRITAMFKVPSRAPKRAPRQPVAQPLPLRWAVIAMFAVSAGGIAMLSSGPIAAIVTACAVSTAMHRILA